jgi:hypothetical protein
MKRFSSLTISVLIFKSKDKKMQLLWIKVQPETGQPEQLQKTFEYINDPDQLSPENMN